MIFMLKNKFIFNNENSLTFLGKYIKLCKELNIPIEYLNISDYTIKNIFNVVNSLNTSSKYLSTKKILHFVSNFSSPSETFIYDLIQRLEDNSNYTNIVLCDKRLLKDERPFDKCLHIDWDETAKSVREVLYEYIFENINPDIIVSHFAINGWKLHQRIESLSITIPMINMTHGIDVFSISNNDAYRDYIINYASVNPMLKFTVVSNYLLKELADREVPIDKISLIPNVIHDRFFANRKTLNFRKKSDILKIINIGRPY